MSVGSLINYGIVFAAISFFYAGIIFPVLSYIYTMRYCRQGLICPCENSYSGGPREAQECAGIADCRKYCIW